LSIVSLVLPGKDNEKNFAGHATRQFREIQKVNFNNGNSEDITDYEYGQVEYNSLKISVSFCSFVEEYQKESGLFQNIYLINPATIDLPPPVEMA